MLVANESKFCSVQSICQDLRLSVTLSLSTDMSAVFAIMLSQILKQSNLFIKEHGFLLPSLVTAY